MRILPTSPKPENLEKGTYPAPPNKEKGAATYAEPRDYGGKKLTSNLQRTYWNGNTRNTLTTPPVLLADWVIEEEVPTAHISFLAYPTRRCFLEDQIQVRVQVGGMTLDGTAEVDIIVERVGRISNDKALFLSTDLPRVTAATHCWFKEHRPLTLSNDIGAELLAQTSANILYEISNTDTRISFLCTSIRLPAPPDDLQTQEEEFIFQVKVRMNGRTYETKSPVLRALRWWADPRLNLGQPKLNAATILPLIDGEAYFAKCAEWINAANHHICIANWSFYCDTFLTNEPGNTIATLNNTLSSLLLAAAKRGVAIYIMVDYFNSEWAKLVAQQPLIDDPINNNTLIEALIPTITNGVSNGLGHPNIHFRIHTHPYKVAGKQVGSVHEKFVLVDGDKGAVGGIDFEPDRYQNSSHSWKSDIDFYRTLAKARGGIKKFGEFILWHDAAVGVTGDIVQNLEHDFFLRWNEAEAGAHAVVPAIRRTADVTKHNAQVVKTSDKKGTFDAYKQAIRDARHYIYIENQYFTYPALGEELCEALKKNPKLQVMVVIPYYTEEVAQLGDRRFASQTAVSALWKFIQDDLDTNEIQERGYRHQQYLQAQIIGRLRETPNAASRVGIYAMAGHLADQRADRHLNSSVTDHHHTKMPNAPYQIEIDGVTTNHAADAAGDFTVTVPQNSKTAHLLYELDEDYLYEYPDSGYAYDYSEEIHIEHEVENNNGYLVTNIKYELLHDGVMAEEGTSAADGRVIFSVPPGIEKAVLRWTGLEAEIPAGANIDDILKDGIGTPLGDTDYKIFHYGVPVANDFSDANGLIIFDIPNDIEKARLKYSLHNEYEFNLGAGAEMVYPHSKTMVVDDTWAIIGSANANGKSLVVDYEMNIVIHDRAFVTDYRKRLWREHLGIDAETRDIRTFFQKWDTTALPSVDKAQECNPALVNGVHAVKYGNPPAGQKYNGPGSWLPFIDMDEQV